MKVLITGGAGFVGSHTAEEIAREYIAWVETYAEVSDYYTSASAAMKEMGVIRVVR
jgi:nucleoside-diphosphate-sugar epimerase